MSSEQQPLEKFIQTPAAQQAVPSLGSHRSAFAGYVFAVGAFLLLALGLSPQVARGGVSAVFVLVAFFLAVAGTAMSMRPAETRGARGILALVLNATIGVVALLSLIVASMYRPM